MKKLLIILLTGIFLFTIPSSVYASAQYNSEIIVNSDIVYVKSVDDGTVIFNKNADVRCSPAALLSIAAAMVVLQNVSDIENTVFTVPEDINNILAGTDSAIMLFKGGEKIRVIDLLHCILIRSAADASVTLAIGVAGSVDAFIAKMNEYAKNIGCSNTNFANVTGLDDERQYTTAADVALMLEDASANETFRNISMTETYDFPATDMSDERVVYTVNLMLKSGYSSYYYPYITSGKTGATSNAGRCVAVTAAKDGYSYVAVIMKGKYEDTNSDGYKENFAFIDCKEVLKWTFSNMRLRVITDPSHTVGEAAVKYSLKYDHVRLAPAKELTALVPSSVDAESIVYRIVEDKTEKTVSAPVKKGEVLGKAEILYGEQVLATVDLVAADDIPFDLPGLIFGMIKNIFSSPIVIILLILIIASAVIYFAVGVRYDKKLGKFRIVKNSEKKKNTKENG